MPVCPRGWSPPPGDAEPALLGVGGLEAQLTIAGEIIDELSSELQSPELQSSLGRQMLLKGFLKIERHGIVGTGAPEAAPSPPSLSDAEQIAARIHQEAKQFREQCRAKYQESARLLHNLSRISLALLVVTIVISIVLGRDFYFYISGAMTLLVNAVGVLSWKQSQADGTRLDLASRDVNAAGKAQMKVLIAKSIPDDRLRAATLAELSLKF